MTAITYFRAQAYNNAWSNYRLLTASKKLSAEELAATRASFFPSIIHTLNHILTVDWLYVGALEGCGVKYGDIDEILCPAIADLEREQRAVDRRLLSLCDALNDAQLAETIDIIRDDWVQTERKDRTLLHLFQHQIHHRGQVHGMLSGTGVAPPQLDEFFMGHEREKALRAEDFAALDFDEEGIWR